MIVTHQKVHYKEQCLIEKVVLQAPFRFSVNFHEEACFIYFSAGSTKINSPFEQVKIEPGGSVLLKCGSYFADLLKYNNAGRYEILVIHLYPEILRQIYRHEIPSFVNKAESSQYIQSIVSHEIINKFIESLYFYFDNPALAGDELLELKIRELILLLVQTNNAASVVSLFSDLFSSRHTTIKEIIHNHLFSGLSIDDMAHLANVSVSTFNRSFQNLYNDTPANYIKTKRLERARELLGVSALTISEIAFQTCFNDVAHFSRSFKAVYHCSPSAYRSSVKRS